MKIYTEIVYSWDEEKSELVEESSKSYDYEGEVTQCHRKTKKIFGKERSVWHTHASLGDIGGGSTADVSQTLQDIGEGKIQDTLEGGLESTVNTIKDPVGATESILTGGKEGLEATGILEEIREGPTGGLPKKVADTLYGGSFKDAVESVQETYRDAEGGFNYYKDNFVKGKIDDNSDDVDAALDAIENPEEQELEGLTPEEIEEIMRKRRGGGSRAEGGSVANRGRSYHVKGAASAGTILSPA